MFNKFYENIKRFIQENYLTLLFYLVFIVTLTYQLPYYIYTKGGCIDTLSRVEVEDAYPIKGSFHLAYVSQVRATIPTYLLAQILPNWTIEDIQDFQISDFETAEDILIRDQLYLKEANTAAIFNAYRTAHKDIQIHKQSLPIIYIDRFQMTNLKIGDVIQTVDGKEVNSIEDIRKIVELHSVGDSIEIQVLRGKKIISCYANVYVEQEKKMIGVSVVNIYDYELNPDLVLKFKKSESGPSGGLMLALTIYNQLVEEDITKGKKIVGTGTIDMDGKVGSIGGVTYKLQGAVSKDADIFIVPNGENYEDAMKEKKKKNYNIQIIGVDSFEDAIEKLNQL